MQRIDLVNVHKFAFPQAESRNGMEKSKEGGARGGFPPSTKENVQECWRNYGNFACLPQTMMRDGEMGLVAC